MSDTERIDKCIALLDRLSDTIVQIVDRLDSLERKADRLEWENKRLWEHDDFNYTMLRSQIVTGDLNTKLDIWNGKGVGK
ncbi:hypothetical protein [Schinkia azotoformans]|uniref:hypothetical protein n=1 Tax=Schinkia azotoformans TaxID=1454 RepID=UPI002DB715DF|nr:hypothetical protein [Schinkia azotoformans]MEC1778414.1 hypothetical protein [Schinkia azotoformans]MED4328341.1 hypothetical protein [Schinkia azotoformans]